MQQLSYTLIAVLGAIVGQSLAAISLDLLSDDSIKRAASVVAYDLMSYYTGNYSGDVPGNLPSPYYWWEAGALFGTMINYWYLTGDTTYNNITEQALLHQAGEDGVYMPSNQTWTVGNDDQVFWGMAAMSAAETGFQNPPESSPGWLTQAQAVFNSQVIRWDTTSCNGGLRWQIFLFKNGYEYKNTISNGGFFNLAARLALYTGNSVYAEWAAKTYEWVHSVGLISPRYEVYDGTQNTNNCSTHDHNRWTYNAGIYLLGSAVMYNYTNGSDLWRERVVGHLNAANDFFSDGVMYEGCEANRACNVDQRSFKAYLARWLAATAKLAPFTHDQIMAKTATSAQAAIKTCTAGSRGTSCGLKWTTGENDQSLGVGEQMAVLEILQSNLVDRAPGWVSTVKGTGTSIGDVNAGIPAENHTLSQAQAKMIPPSTADRVGASFLTGLVMVGVVGGSTMLAMN